ncbi:MAG: hypothetical protein CME65_02090 [Halobacteriovoraceae bacterium]|nr:hypothetical protein [Halobacteriovoraceae bacterium]|tara:strand:- start:8628 stop:9392 length:765 start_codon:yes stop_codon:yes gene_type:complete
MRYYQVEDRFNRYLGIALSLHILVFLGFYLLQSVLDLNILDFSKPPQKIDLIKSAVRVDIVGMPKDTLKELENTNLDQTTTEEEKPAEVVLKENPDQKVFKEKAKKVDIKSFLNSYSAKEVEKKKPTKKKYNETALRKLVLEGNKASTGNSVKGDILDKKNQEFISYVQSLPDQIRPYWKLPSYLASQNLQCRIKIYISKTGKVLRSEVVEPSGQPEYDQKALLAIKKASPLRPPPSSILTRVSSGEVGLGFPL